MKNNLNLGCSGEHMKSILPMCLILSLYASSASAMGTDQSYETCMIDAANVLRKIESCMAKEYKTQKKRLKKDFKVYLDTLPKDTQELAQQAHEQWLSQRDQHCQQPIMTNQSKQNLQQTSCLMHMTQTRADLYEARIGRTAKSTLKPWKYIHAVSKHYKTEKNRVS